MKAASHSSCDGYAHNMLGNSYNKRRSTNAHRRRLQAPRRKLCNFGHPNGSRRAWNLHRPACTPTAISLLAPLFASCYFFGNSAFCGGFLHVLFCFPVLYRETGLECTPKVRHENREQFS